MRRLLLAAVLALALAGCTGDAPPTVEGRASLRIGVKYDQPGLGLRAANGEFAGFDVDVARYLAGRLGAKRVEFVALTSDQRERYLRERKVDLVVATYSITAQRKTLVAFGGPYYVAHQDILVRSDDRSIRTARDLKGKRLCRSMGSNSWRRVIEELGVPAVPVAAPGYGECFRMLIDREIDAITTDDLILAGFALERPGAVRLVNHKFTDEKWGVGLHPGDVAGCEALNRAITRMYQDGTAARLLERWFEPTGLQVTTSVPQFEGC